MKTGKKKRHHIHCSFINCHGTQGKHLLSDFLVNKYDDICLLLFFWHDPYRSRFESDLGKQGDSVTSLQTSPSAAPPTFQLALDDLLQPQPHMIVPSQQALGTFLESCCESLTEVTKSWQSQHSNSHQWINDFPHPDDFTSSPTQFAPVLQQKDFETMHPPLLYIAHVDEIGSMASHEGEACFPSSPQSHLHSGLLSPKSKKCSISHNWFP